MAKLTKIDSNVTGLRYAEEESYKVLPTTPTPEWKPLEPNTYTDFGGQIATVARRPINPGRQLKKGVTTDLDASGGFDTDITQENLQDLLQGFFFASMRRKADVGAGRSPLGQGAAGVDDDFTITDIDTTGDQITVDSRVAASAVVVAGGTGYAVDDIVEVTDANATILARFRVATEAGGVVLTVDLVDPATIVGGFRTRQGRTHTDTGAGAVTTAQTGSGDDALTLTLTYGNGLVWQVGDLVFLAANNDAGNDGLKRLTAVANNVIDTAENLVTDAAPAALATMTTVGFQGAAGDIDVDATGTFPALTSTLLDFTTLGLIPGEFVRNGGDTVATAFQQTSGVNNGYARVRTIAANRLEFDKAENTMETEASTTETIQIFLGRVLKNESDPTLIKRRTYNLERTLGFPESTQPTQEQAEYLTGSVPGDFNIQIPTASKVVSEVGFTAADHETIDAVTPLKTGNRPALVEADAFNTSSDFSRVKMHVWSEGDENPTALFAFIEALTITITNNLTPNKAVGVLGSFEVTAGSFQVGGELTAYFSEVAAIAAVRANADVTLDIHMAKANAGMSLDLPLITLGDGRANVELDTAIKLPLNMDAATGAKIDSGLNHTALIMFWDYLPTAAE